MSVNAAFRGLSARDAAERRARYGASRLVPEERRSPLGRYLRPFADPMVLLLLGASGAYVARDDGFDAAVTLAAVAPIAVTWRDGVRARIPAEDLVPGDVIELGARRHTCRPVGPAELAGAALAAAAGVTWSEV